MSERRAGYEDVLAAPPNKVAEVLDGELCLSPRPALPHAAAATALGEELGPPFKRGRGGPGGWLILDEPELHLADDILGVCEVISPSTEQRDRTAKLSIYARAEVTYAWLVNPDQRLLEVLRLGRDGWLRLAAHRDDERVRAEPFDAIELDLSVLWVDAEQ